MDYRMKTRLLFPFACKFVIALLFVLRASPAQSQTPAFWGMTNGGGTDDVGTIFKMAPDGTGLTNVRSFTYTTPGRSGDESSVQLWQSPAGKLYGVTANGGLKGSGVLYEYDPSTGVYAVKYNFDYTDVSGYYPVTSLVPGSNGKLYGMTTYGGTSNKGVLYEFDLTTGTYTKKVDFTGTNGASPSAGSLYLHTNGKLYGFTAFGGTNNFGVLFEYDPATSTYTKKIDFLGVADGKFPYAGLTRASSGKLYGTTIQGGTNDQGTLFEYNPTTNVLTKLVDFISSNGFAPASALVEADNGQLYGVTAAGGSSSGGVLFEFNPSTNVYTKKIDFTNENGRGAIGGLFKANNGKLYGLTYFGGSSNGGVLYEYEPATNTYTKKYDFIYTPSTSTSVDGALPRATLMQASNGLLYATTSIGGSSKSGVLFEYNISTNTYAKKIDFNGAPSGRYPNSGLMQASNGKLYGLTNTGGANGEGVLFEIDPVTNAFATKYSFSSTDGSFPSGVLVQATNGKLYGLSSFGGLNSIGALFEFDPSSGVYSKKFDFDGTNGKRPQGSMILAANSKLYGMSSEGGANSNGVLFEYDPATNTLIKKIDFDNTTSGQYPNGDLIQANNGKLYGMSYDGGNGGGSGVLFEYNIATNTLTPRVTFGADDGENPTGSLVQAPNGKLYGMTTAGGTNLQGVLFEFDPATNSYVKKLNFDGANTGYQPNGSLAVSPNGKLYCGTTYGGANGRGVIFEYDPATNVFTKKHDFNGTDGGGFLYSRLLFVKGEQTISFAALPDKTIGDAAFALNATTTSTLPVSFSTTSTTITLSGSQVTIVSAGRVIITATQTGNTNYNVATPVERSFCIKPAQPTITLSNLNSETPTLTSSASTGNQWYRNDVVISGATNTVLTATEEGTYKVRSVVDDCVSNFSDEVILVVTSLEENGNQISLFPNPTADWITVSLNELNGNKQISIVNTQGMVKESREVEGSETTFNVAAYARGVYFVKVKMKNSVRILRFVKQ
jgi:uncharacterized repeat protein (TIGR03803 family)